MVVHTATGLAELLAVAVENALHRSCRLLVVEPW